MHPRLTEALPATQQSLCAPTALSPPSPHLDGVGENPRGAQALAEGDHVASGALVQHHLHLGGSSWAECCSWTECCSWAQCCSGSQQQAVSRRCARPAPPPPKRHPLKTAVKVLTATNSPSISCDTVGLCSDGRMAVTCSRQRGVASQHPTHPAVQQRAGWAAGGLRREAGAQHQPQVSPASGIAIQVGSTACRAPSSRAHAMRSCTLSSTPALQVPIAENWPTGAHLCKLVGGAVELEAHLVAPQDRALKSVGADWGRG